MMPRLASLSLSLMLMASCESSRIDDQPSGEVQGLRVSNAATIPSALAQYSDLARFVPPEMTGFLFREYRNEDGSTEVRELYAGRDSDTKTPAGAMFRVLEVFDFGPGNDWTEIRTLLGKPNHLINGVPCWHSPEGSFEKGYVQAPWTAHVNKRIQLVAYDRETMAQALTRPGRIDKILAPFDHLSLLPDSATCYVFNQAREARPDTNVPIANGKIMWALLSKPWRIRVVRQAPLTIQHLETLKSSTSWARRTTIQDGDVWIEEAECTSQEPSLHRHVSSHVIFDVLFGWLMYWI